MGASTRVVAALALGVAAVASAATVILLASPLPPLHIAAGRVTVTAVVLLLLGRRELRSLLEAMRERPALGWRTLGAGTLLAVHFGAWIASLGLTSVLRSMALVALQPVFAGLLGRVLGDRVSPWLYAGAAVSLAGSIVLVGGTSALEGGTLGGDALALLGGASAAAYLAFGRSVRSAVPLRAYLGGVHGVAAVLLLPLAWIVQPIGEGVDAGSWFAVLYLGLVPGVIGHGLFNWVVRQVPIDRVALAILLEPAAATLLAWAVLDRTVTGSEILGASIVLLGVGVGSIAARRGAASGSAGG